MKSQSSFDLHFLMAKENVEFFSYHNWPAVLLLLKNYLFICAITEWPT